MSHGELDQAALELCAKTVVQAFALAKTKKMATNDNVSCKILERPQGKTLWGEALVLDRHEKQVRFAVDILDRRVGVGVVSLSVEGGRLTVMWPFLGRLDENAATSHLTIFDRATPTTAPR